MRKWRPRQCSHDRWCGDSLCPPNVYFFGRRVCGSSRQCVKRSVEQAGLSVRLLLQCSVIDAAAIGENVAHHGTLCEQSRSEEHTSELQSLMRNSYAVFCL